MKNTIRYSVLFLIAVLSFCMLNSQNADSNTSRSSTLTVNVIGTGCESVSIYAIDGNNPGNPIYLIPVSPGSCQYSANVSGDSFTVYACVSDKHGDVQVKIGDDDDSLPTDLVLVGGECPYGNP